MKEIVRTIAANLVDSPSQVVVTQTEDKDDIIVELAVAQEDMGKVIGKNGRIAKAIRTVLKSAGIKADKYVTLKILEE